MSIEIKDIIQEQLPSGQIRTYILNDDEAWTKEVFCITPTYLTVLFLRSLRSSGKVGGQMVDEIITKGTKFLVDKLYCDPITGTLVCHFNSFYPPDWEDTLMVTLLGFEEGLITKNELEPLRVLLKQNCTKNGIGVWVRDPYSKGNSLNNDFDPVVSRAVSFWLRTIWDEKWDEVENCPSSTESLYYHPAIQKLLVNFFDNNEIGILEGYNHSDSRLFHHNKRGQVWYSSPALMSLLRSQYR